MVWLLVVWFFDWFLVVWFFDWLFMMGFLVDWLFMMGFFVDGFFNDWGSIALGEWRASADTGIKVGSSWTSDGNWGAGNTHDVFAAVSWVGVNAKLTTGTAGELSRGNSQAGNQSGSNEKFHLENFFSEMIGGVKEKDCFLSNSKLRMVIFD